MLKLINIDSYYQVMLSDAISKVLTKHFASESVAISVSLTLNFNVNNLNRVFTVKWIVRVIFICGNTDTISVYG